MAAIVGLRQSRIASGRGLACLFIDCDRSGHRSEPSANSEISAPAQKWPPAPSRMIDANIVALVRLAEQVGRVRATFRELTAFRFSGRLRVTTATPPPSTADLHCLRFRHLEPLQKTLPHERCIAYSIQNYCPDGACRHGGSVGSDSGHRPFEPFLRTVLRDAARPTTVPMSSKIERPDSGDDARSMPPFIGDESAPFMIWNRNKRSITLDLKSEDGKAALLSLIDTADILIEISVPGTLERLGFVVGRCLSARNPRLIYAAISGFGQTGPYRDRGGFDLDDAGHVRTDERMRPCGGPSPPAADRHLRYRRRHAPRGRHSGARWRRDIGPDRASSSRHRCSSSALSFGVYEAAHVAATGERPPRLGQAHRGSSPYQVFGTPDGSITVGASQPNFWLRLCEIARHCPNWCAIRASRRTPSRVKNNDALVRAACRHASGRPSAHWLRRPEEGRHPVWSGPCFDEAMADPQVVAREMVVETEHLRPGTFGRSGFRQSYRDTRALLRRPAPRLGEHTAEVLRRDDVTGTRRGAKCLKQNRRGWSIERELRQERPPCSPAAVAARPPAARSPASRADTIKIGTFGALTGPGYLYGKLPMNGVEVVFDEINAAGGIHGRKLQLVREDDRCDPASAIGAVQKLVQQDRFSQSSAAAAATPRSPRRETIEKLQGAVTDLRLRARRDHHPAGPNIFSTALTSDNREPGPARRSRIEQGAKKIAMVSMRDAWGRPATRR